MRLYSRRWLALRTGSSEAALRAAHKSQHAVRRNIDTFALRAWKPNLEVSYAASATRDVTVRHAVRAEATPTVPSTH